MIVTMKTSVAIECGKGELYFVLRMECCWILYLSCHSQPEQLGNESNLLPSVLSRTEQMQERIAERNLRWIVPAQGVLSANTMEAIYPQQAQATQGQLHNSDPPKRFQDKPTRAYKVQSTDWWMTEPGLLRLDWHPCNLPTSKSQCEAGKPWTGWNGHPWHLQCFHAAAMFKSWRKMFAYSVVHPAHDWGECVKWGNLSHSDCLKRRCWGWGVWSFWMLTGTALLKVKTRTGTQCCSITRNTEKSSISDDHPTLHRHSLLWLFRWWLNSSNSLRLLFQLVKNTPSYPAKEQKWMTGKEIQQLRPAKRPARDKHSNATHKVQKKLLQWLFVPFDSNKMTECQLSRGGRCLEYQMTSDLSCSWAIFDPQWLLNRMPLTPDKMSRSTCQPWRIMAPKEH